MLACGYREKTSIPVDWKFPSTARENLRYRVFKDLWEKGHYLTAATKFGGDFLAYPGQLLAVHK